MNQNSVVRNGKFSESGKEDLVVHGVECRGQVEENENRREGQGSGSTELLCPREEGRLSGVSSLLKPD